jgi:hypothetical protein
MGATALEWCLSGESHARLNGTFVTENHWKKGQFCKTATPKLSILSVAFDPYWYFDGRFYGLPEVGIGRRTHWRVMPSKDASYHGIVQPIYLIAVVLILVIKFMWCPKSIIKGRHC